MSSTMAGDVSAGASTPVQNVATCWIPLSVNVGTSGSAGCRRPAVTANGFSLPSLIKGKRIEMSINDNWA